MSRVLIVDDEKTIVKGIKFSLEQDGMETDCAYDGEEALEPRNGNPYAALHRSKNLSEVERLRLLVAKQEVEIARLKKGYWVEGVGADREYVTGRGKTTKFSKN